MRLGFRLVGGAALALALFAGDLGALSLAPAAALAEGYGGFRGGGGFHSGGFRDHDGFRGGWGGWGGGYRGYGYGGYYGGFGLGEALLGAAIIGGTAAIIASNDRPVYETYPAYQTYPPAYAASGDYGYAPQAVEPAYTAHDPVEQCSRAAVREAAARGDSGRVVSIDHVDGRQNGAQVVGTLEVRRGDHSTERARFTCTADYGQVTGFRFG